MQQLEILEGLFRNHVDGITIDYQVRFDVSGKVYGSKALLFDLPETAQQLTLGEESREEKKEQIEHFRRLIPVILPLGIVNQGTFYRDGLADIYQRINHWVKKNNIPPNRLHQLAESESLEYYILASFETPSSFPEDFREQWPKAMDIIREIDEKASIDKMKYLAWYYPHFGFRILSLIIPLIRKPHTKYLIFETLQYYQADVCRDYLLKSLDNYQENRVLFGIFRALAEQDISAPAIQKKTVDIYYSGLELGLGTKAQILSVLKHFPSEQVFQIGLDIIAGNSRQSSTDAAKILLDMGYPPQKIVEQLLPKLHLTDAKESEVAFAVFGKLEQLDAFLPKTEELLKIYVETLRKTSVPSVIDSMHAIIKRTFDHSTPVLLLKFFTDRNAKVLEGIADLISRLANYSDVNFELFMSTPWEQRAIQLLGHEKPNVASVCYEILKRIGRAKGKEEYIKLFNAQIEFEKNKQGSVSAMRAINYVLPAVKFNPIIVDNYLKAVKQANDYYRVDALMGLRYSNDRQLKKSLVYLERDSSESVRKAYALLEVPPKRIPPVSPIQRLIKKLLPKPLHQKKPTSQTERMMEYLGKEVSKNRDEQQARLQKFKLK